MGPSTTVAYYRQDVGHLPLESTIYEAIATERPLWERRQVQGHLGRFGFSGDEVQRTVGTLSGGERARVALALLTLSTNNLLILDEPTNHLDVESIEAMEDAIDGYEGSVLIVSHDRAVLRGLASQVWELKDQALHVFSGSFVEWEAARAELRAKADRESRDASQQQAAANAKQREKERDRERDQAKAGKAAAARGGSTSTAKGGGKSGALAHSGKQAPAPTGDVKKLLRAAERLVSDAELRVAVLEGKIGELTSQLDDPKLYDTPAGVQRASNLGKALDDARDALDDAVHEWTAAGERLEQLRK
jgi:ATP-binding cassette subfamily F protein 3